LTGLGFAKLCPAGASPLIYPWSPADDNQPNRRDEIASLSYQSFAGIEKTLASMLAGGFGSAGAVQLHRNTAESPRHGSQLAESSA
jgi:hypothetical protein